MTRLETAARTAAFRLSRPGAWVDARDVEAYRAWLTEQGPDYIAPHRRAAVFALRGFTGRDVPQATAEAWRRAIE